MTYKVTFIKQSEDWLYAHIYEHFVVNAFIEYMSNAKYYRNIDYVLDANSNDGIITIDLSSYSLDIGKLFKKFTVSHKDITIDESKIAALQVSIEYGRRLEHLEVGLVDELDKIHETAWNDLNGKYISKAIKKQIDEYERNQIALGDEGSLRTKPYELIYEIPNCPFELKTLGAYLLQAIGLNIIDHCYRELEACYDAGDLWAEYQENLGYITKMSVMFGLVNPIARIRKIQKTTIEEMSKKVNIKKLINFAKKDFAGDDPYFSKNTLYANTYQFIGSKTFMETATVENVEKLLSMLKKQVFTIVVEDSTVCK
jgi:hypothetical protein